MERSIREFLEAFFEGPDTRRPAELEQLLEQTPRRVAAAFSDDLLVGYREEPAADLEPSPLAGAVGPVLLSGIRFTSVCAHHLLPYRGEAHVGFLPRRGHVGLGSIARVVDSLARRLTLQETLTAEIADTLDRGLESEAVVVVVDAEHMCLSVRGARKTGHRFRTIEWRGERSADLDRFVGGL
jgi:GTP cyclohydrolase I